MLEKIPRREWNDLFIAWLAIALAFMLRYTRGGTAPLIEIFAIFAICLTTVGIGFIFHEMAHKFTAMHYGYWAEFQKSTSMLLVAVVLAALVGVVFAAPGATVIYGTYLTREQNGKISAAGPVTNLLLCIPFFGLLLCIPFFGIELGSVGWWLLGRVGTTGIQVNAMIAAFNMLPVSILDGKKVLAWNPAIFGILIVLGFGALIAALSIPDFFSLFL